MKFARVGFSSPIALTTFPPLFNCGFVPLRRPGKLPFETINIGYGLEYGLGEMQIHKDGVEKGQRVIVADDLLATGGTALAGCKLVEQLGGEVVACSFAIELADLKGRELLADYYIDVAIEM